MPYKSRFDAAYFEKMAKDQAAFMERHNATLSVNVTPLHMEDERIQEALKLELGERALHRLNWESMFNIEKQISEWRHQENVAVLYWAKEHEPEKLAQAVGDVQHRNRVNAYFRSGGTPF